MYSKIALLITLSLALAFAQKQCDCSDAEVDQAMKESNDIVGFLNELATKDISDEEKYPVVPPNVITGMLACDCNENFSRRKRKIFPDESITLAPKLTPKTPHLSRRNCPKGYSRIGAICMPKDLLF